MTVSIDFRNPESGNLGRHIASAAGRGLPMVEKDCLAAGPGAVICGLGPSLQKPAVLNQVRDYAERGWIIFGLKEALRFLVEKDIQPRFSANMDPTVHEVGRTPVLDGVTYCLASSCHPDLYDHVLGHGGAVKVFHSACGYVEAKCDPGFMVDLGADQQAVVLGEYALSTTEGYGFSPIVVARLDEVAVYRRHFANADTMCGGFTVGNRAVALAKYMGIEKIVVAGLDFGWRDGATYYAEFCRATPLRDVLMHDDGKVDGRPWHTRPDLLASAKDIALRVKAGEVIVLGDSLAASLAKHDEVYIQGICRIQ